MASSFWMRSQMVQGRYLYVECTQTQNVADNTSTIHWTLVSTGGSSSFYTTGPTQVLIGENLVYEKPRVSYSTGQFPAAKGSVSGTTTVKHDDVTGEATIAVTIYTMIYNGVQETRTEYWTLDPNPRFASLKSAPDFHDEENPVITYSNPAGTQAAALQACISLTGEADDIAYRDIPKDATTYTFSLSEAERDVLRSAFPNANSGSVQFCVRSVIGGNTQVSSLTRNFTIKNPEPVISPTITDSNDVTTALTGNRSKLVRYYSNATVTIGAAAVKKATLKSQKVTCGKISLTEDGTFSALENGIFTFTATDSRGNTTTKAVEMPMVPYVKLTCGLNSNMPSTDGTMTVRASGHYFNGSFGAKSNNLKVYYRYKTAGGSYGSWVAMTTALSGNTYSATANVSGLDYQTNYVFQAYAVDALATVYASEQSVRAQPVFDWDKDDFKFHVDVEVDRKIITEGIVFKEQDIYVEGDLNTYYPVHITTNLISSGAPQYLFIKKLLGTVSPAWSGNHSSGTSSMRAGWMLRNGGWDGNGNFCSTLFKREEYAKLLSHIALATNGATGIVLYLRGGGASYQICSNYPITVSVHHTNTNISTNASYAYTVAPRTDMGNGGVLYTSVPFNIDAVYPVNSIYISYSHTSPAALFGGTWQRLENRFLWGTSASGMIGATAGEQTHILTTGEMPSHSHDMPFSGSSSGVQSPYKYIVLSSAASNGDGGKGYRNNMGTFPVGEGVAHNNMPPYIQVSIWRRTA